MTKAPISLQDLRRRLYIKAKTESTWRFWGLYVHVCKRETLREAYRQAKANDGAPGIDGVTFAAVEAGGAEEFLDQLRKELVERTYRPQKARKVEIPKGGGKMRQLDDDAVLWFLQLLLDASGKQGVPQGGVMTPRTQKVTSNLSGGCGFGVNRVRI